MAKTKKKRGISLQAENAQRRIENVREHAENVNINNNLQYSPVMSVQYHDDNSENENIAHGTRIGLTSPNPSLGSVVRKINRINKNSRVDIFHTTYKIENKKETDFQKAQKRANEKQLMKTEEEKRLEPAQKAIEARENWIALICNGDIEYNKRETRSREEILEEIHAERRREKIRSKIRRA